MSAAAVIVSLILVVFACLLLSLVWRLAVRAWAALSRWNTRRYLIQQCGSRARANRFMVALTRSCNDGLPPLAPSSLSSIARSAAGTVGRSTPESVSADHIGEAFPNLMFARRQAD